MNFKDIKVKTKKDNSSLFGLGDFVNALSLCHKFVIREDPLSSYLQEQLSSETQDLLQQCLKNNRATKEFLTALSNDLNKLLKSPCLYNQERFHHVILSAETTQLLEQQPTGEKLIHLNRMLLEDAYTHEIAKKLKEWHLKYFNKLCREDWDLFYELITQVYGKPLEESYVLLSKETENIIVSQCNGYPLKYKSSVDNNLEDITEAVIYRLVYVNAKEVSEGRKINSVEAIARRTVHFTLKEFFRLEKKHLGQSTVTNDLDGFENIPNSNANTLKELEEKEKRRIEEQCVYECLKNLPNYILDMLFEYYSYEKLPMAQRAEKRVNQALKLANISAAEATPEEIKGAIGKLQVKVFRWRTKNLSCKEKCMEQKTYRKK